VVALEEVLFEAGDVSATRQHQMPPDRFLRQVQFAQELSIIGHNVLKAEVNSGGSRRVAVPAKSWKSDVEERPNFCVSLSTGVR